MLPRNSPPNPQTPLPSRPHRAAAPPPPAHRLGKRVLAVLIVALLIAAGYFAWLRLRPKTLGPAFASGNGRVEATELDVASKNAGRITEMLVDDGDFVSAGQPVARIDTDVLRAQLQQARAEVAEARNGVEAALSVIGQRQSEAAAAQAVVSQREAEQVSAEKTADRTRVLSEQHAASIQEYEDDLARQKGSAAAVLAAEAQVAASQATITAANSQVLEARSAWKLPSPSKTGSDRRSPTTSCEPLAQDACSSASRSPARSSLPAERSSAWSI